MPTRNDHPLEPPPVLEYQTRLPRRMSWCSGLRFTKSEIIAVIVLVAGGMWMMAHLSPKTSGHFERLRRAKCMANLHMLGQSLALYLNDHAGAYPTQLADILVHCELDPSCFVCPSSDDEPAAGPTTPAVLAQFAQPGHCSYTYLSAGLTSASIKGSMIIMTEDSRHHEEGMHVLLADGRVEWIEKGKRMEKVLKGTATACPFELPSK